MIERNKTNVALDGLFEQFLNLISEARRVPLVDKIMVDENDLLNIIDDLKEAIPREIKSANQVLEEQKNIVNKAYADADRIVQQAKDEAERIVSVAQAEADAKGQQEEIVKQANAAAEDIKANALRYQEETKTAADDYALQVKQDSCQEQKYSDYYNYCPFSYHFNFLRTPVLQYKCRAKQLIFQYSYIYNLIKRRGKQK